MIRAKGLQNNVSGRVTAMTEGGLHAAVGIEEEDVDAGRYDQNNG